MRTETCETVSRVVLDADAMHRTVVRLAHQIRERNPDLSRLALIGVRSRGVPLARRLQRALEDIAGARVPVGEIDISAYRDDLGHPPERRGHAISAPFRIEGRDLVLVDDVLYTGRTSRAALDALVDHGRPARVQLLVMVDRGHRELPIKPDYVGKNLPSAHDEEVQVRLVETDGVDEVRIVRKAGRNG